MATIITPVVDLVIGIALAVFAGILYNLGAIYMKKGVVSLAELNIKDMKTIWALFKSRAWMAGFLTGVAGNVPYIFAQSIAGVTLVQPITGTGFIALAIFAKKMLGEELRTIEKTAIALLVVAPFCLAFAGVSKVADQALAAETWEKFFMFFGIIAVFLVIIFIIKARVPGKSGEFLAINAGVMFGVSSLGSQLATITLRPLLAAGTFHGIAWWEFIPAALLWIGPNVIAGLWQQQSLQKGKAARVIPLQNTSGLIIPVIGGILIFDQIVGSWIFFLIGIIFIGVSAIMLTRLQAEIHELQGNPVKN